MNKVLLPLVFSVIALSLIGYQDAFAVTFFTDRPSWEAAVAGAPITDDPFDNNIANANVIIFDSGVVSTGVGSNPTINRVIGGVYDGHVDKNDALAYESITWNFPNPITGFGADFATACSGGFLVIISDFEGAGDMTVKIDDHLPGDCFGFFGIVSSSSFQSVTYTSGTGGPATAEFWNMDDLSFATLQDEIIGGTIIPIDQTALLLAGVQSVSMWMIPVVLSGAGIGVFVIMRSRK